MSRLLGRLEWALRPNAGATAFLASAYQWLMGDHIYCGLSLLRSLMTAIIFALLPQRLQPDNCPALPREGVADKYILFCDAAPSPDGRRFFMGVYLPSGGFRHWRCPKWVKTLQQADFLPLFVVSSLLDLWAGAEPIWVLTVLWPVPKPLLCVPALLCPRNSKY